MTNWKGWKIKLQSNFILLGKKSGVDQKLWNKSIMIIINGSVKPNVWPSEVWTHEHNTTYHNNVNQNYPNYYILIYVHSLLTLTFILPKNILGSMIFWNRKGWINMCVLNRVYITRMKQWNSLILSSWDKIDTQRRQNIK